MKPTETVEVTKSTLHIPQSRQSGNCPHCGGPLFQTYGEQPSTDGKKTISMWYGDDHSCIEYLAGRVKQLEEALSRVEFTPGS